MLQKQISKIDLRGFELKFEADFKIVKEFLHFFEAN